MEMNIIGLFFTWLLKKKAEVNACSDSPPRPLPLPTDASGDGDFDSDSEEVWAAKKYRDSLKERKKLCLVINLDTVLVDTIDLCHLTRYDIYYFGNSGVQTSYKEGQLHTLFFPAKVKTKLRPYLRSFLKDMSLEYDIVLYSKRSPVYAERIRKLLDPDGALNLRVISLGNSKSAQHHPQLKLFLSIPDSLVILDDTEIGWDKKYKSNLIKVAPYPYFCRAKVKSKSWTQLKGDECEKGGELYRLCHRLGSLRRIIYTPTLDFHDARQVLEKFRSNNCLDNFHSCSI